MNNFTGNNPFQQDNETAIDNSWLEADASIYGLPQSTPIKQNDSKFVFSATGVKIDESATIDEICAKIAVVHSVETAVHWVYGDLLAFASKHDWGRVYQYTQEITGKTIKTLENYAWVARSIHYSLRGENLGYSHYKLIAKLSPKDQSIWVQKAVKGGWSVKRLHEEMEGIYIPENTPPHVTQVIQVANRYRTQWNKLSSDEKRDVYRMLTGLLEEMEDWGLE